MTKASTASALALAACALPALAVPTVLDDYSSDVNFWAGRYRFMDV